MSVKKLLLPLLFLAATWPLLRDRWTWEKDAAVALCVDGEELEHFHPSADIPGLLKGLASEGVSAVAFRSEDDGDALRAAERWAGRLPPGMGLALRPVFEKPSKGRRPPNIKDLLPLGDSVRYLLPAGDALPFAGADSPLHLALGGTSWLFPWVEFSRSPALSALAKAFPERVLRAHSIDEDEILSLTPEKAAARFRRAARERGARFLYVRFFPGLSPEKNAAYVRDLARGLREDGFVLGDAHPRFPTAPPGFPLLLQKSAAFLIAALGPWLAFRWCRRAALPVWARVPFLGVLSLAAGLLAAAVLSSGPFLLGLDSFRGVKLALVIPLLLSAAELYQGEERRALLRKPLTFGAAAAALLLGLIALVYLLRSGHDGGLGAGPLELRFRESLEALFSVRPRFKEFSVGWPLLCLAVALEVPGRGEKRAGPPAWDPRPFWIAGLVAPVSVVNSFCHAHVPLGVSLLRSFHGFWLGILLGFGLILARRIIPWRR